MKILYVHNEYAKPSGEEHAANEIVKLLREHGHTVEWFTRSSAELSGLAGNIKGLLTGLYNPAAARKLARKLDEFKPDIVQVQNLYPLLSTAIFRPIRKRRIPIVMRCPNYRLFCPSGLSLDPEGRVCERCWHHGEWNCIRLDCGKSIFRSIGYAARNAFARLSRNITSNVDAFIVQSEFQRQKFAQMGILPNKLFIVPGLTPTLPQSETGDRNLFHFSSKSPAQPPCLGRQPELPPADWVSFVGRASAEKGIDEFIQAARLCPDIPFKVAGNIDAKYQVPHPLPPNLEFVGFLSGNALDDLYRASRIIVVPSKWYEGFPNVIVRGMLHARPVITTDIGAMQSIIDHDQNGLLVPPGDAQALAAAITRLWPDLPSCHRLGTAAQQKARTAYSRPTIYHHLHHLYQSLLTHTPKPNTFPHAPHPQP